MTQHINDLKENYTSLVDNARQEYLHGQSKNLSNSDTGVMTYLSILIQFLNKNKFPIIPPLFHRNKFDFQGKATLLNNLFVSQCTLLNTGSLLPLFRPITESIFEKVLFNNGDIISHVQGLNPNKTHGWDGITIRMIQICGDTHCHSSVNYLH